MDTKFITLGEMNESQSLNLIGPEDRNLKVLSECFDKRISYRDNQFAIQDCDDGTAAQIKEVLIALYEVACKNRQVTEQDVIYACRLTAKSEKVRLDDLSGYIVGRTMTGRAIAPKTKGQFYFVHAIERHDIVFAIGPAGTGKTYLAVVKAVSALKSGMVKQIVLTRPAVEAGESLGFLPGDLKEKVDPYLTPLYDSLHDMLGAEQTDRLIEKGTIEIAPLAYMRGRTLDDSFVILDEAQNTTPAQMKMFLTRLGFNSHMVITGDVTQIDLRPGIESGLVNAARILSEIPEIAIIKLTSDDVIRHPLVQKIIESYGRAYNVDQ